MRATNRGIAVVCFFALGMSATDGRAQELPPGRGVDSLPTTVELTMPSPIKARLPQLLQELVKAGKSDEQVIEALYLAALTRLPTEQEVKNARQQVGEGKDRLSSLEKKVLKSLTQSPEFGRLHPDPVSVKVLPLNRLPREKRDPNAPGKGPFFGR